MSSDLPRSSEGHEQVQPSATPARRVKAGGFVAESSDVEEAISPDALPVLPNFYLADWKKVLNEANLEWGESLVKEWNQLGEEMEALEVTEQELKQEQELKNGTRWDSTALRQYYGRQASSLPEGPDRERANGYFRTLLNLHEAKMKLSAVLRKLKKAPYPSPRLPQVTGYPEDFGKRFWAVIIGISGYNDGTKSLYGGHSDAQYMQEFLSQELHVPLDNIVLLTSPWDKENPNPDARPTRENMLKTLYSHLRDNPNVILGDKIMIFYAGHGASYEPYVFGKAKRIQDYIEAICPMDRTPNGTDSTGKLVPDISGRELNIIISEIQAAKGSNIIFCADCCYSGGVDRKAETEDGQQYTLRTTDPVDNNADLMLDRADSDTRRTSSRRAGDPGYTPNMDSHVLLAASQDYELSDEKLSKGIFTNALLNELYKISYTQSQETSYSTLIEKVKLALQATGTPMQEPKVDGFGKDSMLWFQPKANPDT